MHASKTMCSKPNKQIKNNMARYQAVENNVGVLWPCAPALYAYYDFGSSLMLRHARKCKREQHSCVPASFQRVIIIICNYFYLKKYIYISSVTALTAAFPLRVSRVI